MSFGQPFPFNPLVIAQNPQLLIAASLNSKPPGSAESITSFPSIPSVITSGGNAVAEMSAETLRFLSAGHPSFPPQAFGPRADMGGLPGLAAMEQYRGMAPGMPPFGLYPGLGGPELKSPDGLNLNGGLPSQPVPGYFYDPTMAGYPYPGPLDLNGARRKNATRETTAALKAWLYEHRKNPYPTKGEKIMLAIITKMTLTQVSTWFANARRRLKKENKMTWSPRNRPGEDDDDIGGPDESGDRPSSSLSGGSDLGIDGSTLLPADEHKTPEEANNNKDRESELKSDTSANNGDIAQPGQKRPASRTEPETPIKKPKIWSIADTVCSSSSETPRSDSASKKPDSGPFHFTFNPWQQQMAALAAAGKPTLMTPHGPLAFGPLGHPMAQLRPELFIPRPGLLQPHPPYFGINPVHLVSNAQAFIPSPVQTSTPGPGVKISDCNPPPANSLSPVSSVNDESNVQPSKMTV